MDVAESKDMLNLSPPLNMIDVIYGGPRPTWKSGGARNRYIKEAREGVFSVQEESLLKNPWLNMQMPNLTISSQELKKGIHHPNNDPLMITGQIGLSIASKILVNTKNAVNVIFKHAFDQMNIPESKLELSLEPIFGFNNKGSTPVGWVKLLVQMDLPTCCRTFEILFVIIDQSSITMLSSTAQL